METRRAGYRSPEMTRNLRRRRRSQGHFLVYAERRDALLERRSRHSDVRRRRRRTHFQTCVVRPATSQPTNHISLLQQHILLLSLSLSIDGNGLKHF